MSYPKRADRVMPHASVSRRFLIIAHRGAARIAAENTIEAFEKAVELGANAIETDVFRCYIGGGYHTLLWHDPDPNSFFALLRQWGMEFFSSYVPLAPSLGSRLRRPLGSAALQDPFAAELTHRYARRVRWSEIYWKLGNGVRKAIAFWSKAGAFEMVCRYARHPSLLIKKRYGEVSVTDAEDLIAFLRREKQITDVHFDVKHKPWQSGGVVAFLHELQEYIAKGGLSHIIFHLMSTHEEVIAALLAALQGVHAPTIKVCADIDRPGVRRITRRLGVRDVAVGRGARLFLWWMFWPQVKVAIRERDRGRLETVIVWTVNTEKGMRALLDLGVDGIITDYPDRLRRIVEQEYPWLVLS